MDNGGDRGGLETTGRRKSFRFALSVSVDVMSGEERCAFATLIDLSRDGCAVRSMMPLAIGRAYRFHIRSVVTWPGKVVRRFDGCSYGVMFDAPESERRRMDIILSDILEGGNAACVHLPQGVKPRAF